MTRPNTTRSQSGPGSASSVSPLGRLIQACVEAAARKASEKIGDWTDRLDEVTANGGALQRAGLAGGLASLMDINPLWAAMKGAWSGASWKVKLLVVLVLVLILVLAPVLLLLLVLGLLVAGVIAGIRAATR